MSDPRLTFLSHQDDQLQSWLTGHPEQHERGAILLMRRHRLESQTLEDSDRYQVVEVHPIPDEWVTSSGREHFEFQNRHLRPLMQACEERGLVMGFAHSHPSGYDRFSPQDEVNEQSMIRGLANRNGLGVSFVALVLCDGKWLGRVRHAKQPTHSDPLRHILVLAHPLRIHLHGESRQIGDPEVWARQSAAYGEPFQRKVQSLRVGVNGAGGTGSPTYTMLARSGFTEVVSVDFDLLEKSNLNRVHGSSMDDVGKPKVDIARDCIVAMGLGTKVHSVNAQCDTSPEAIDALLTCDLVFGATDDNLGRSALDSLCYRHGILGIDMGLSGGVHKPVEGAANPSLRYYQEGRVTTLLPGVAGYRCMQCEGVYDQEDLRADQFNRDYPNATQEEKKEKYIKGGEVRAPGIGPFTSLLANLALTQLYDLIQGFRDGRTPPELRRSNFLMDFVKMDFSSKSEPQSECALCFAKGASLPGGLLVDYGYRLGRPVLGELKRNE